MTIDSQESKEKLLKIVDDAVKHDDELRQQLEIGEKFRFIRDRLKALQQSVHDALQTIKVIDEVKERIIAEDETLVFVYLFNAHGVDLQSWLKMVQPAVYYEYSVNRPIYNDKEHIESLVRSKANRIQHGYLVFVIKKAEIISKPDTATKDNLGLPMVKIKEGTLKRENLLAFMHNNNQYELDEDDRLKRKY